MKALYNLSIFLYSVLIRLAAPFDVKARQIFAGRRKAFGELKSKLRYDRPVIWIHCASLGEFEQGRPVIEKIKNEHPEYQILLTFFSPSGYEIRKNYNLADYIIYLPADTKKNATKLIELVKPELVFFVKYEFWYHYIHELRKRNIPVYLFSAIFQERQSFFRNTPWGRWYRKILENFEHLFVQDTKSVELLNKIGIKNVTQAGDTRFDRVSEIAKNRKSIPLVEKFMNGSKVVVAGSTWKPDEELLAKYIQQHPEIKFIIAPHEIHLSNVTRLISLLKSQTICYTEATEETVMNKQVLIVDTIGLLSSLYQYADIAYIGGGFGVGIHNTLEAAIFGMPVIFGPNYLKFNEAVAMADLKVAFPVSDYSSLETILDDLMNNATKRASISAECRKFTDANTGATRQIVNKVFNIS